jgi:hypothetical protein
LFALGVRRQKGWGREVQILSIHGFCAVTGIRKVQILNLSEQGASGFTG